jgi:ribosomal protein S26
MAKDTEIKRLSDLIEKLVSKEVLPVDPVTPIAPVLPIVPQNPLDHDLLTKLDAKVDQIQVDVTSLKNQTSFYVNRTEHLEVVRVQSDHETRTRSLEVFKENIQGRMWAIGTLISLLATIAGVIIEHFIVK